MQPMQAGERTDGLLPGRALGSALVWVWTRAPCLSQGGGLSVSRHESEQLFVQFS